MIHRITLHLVLCVFVLLSACASPPAPTQAPTAPPAPPTATLVPTPAPTYSPTEMARLNPAPRGGTSLTYNAKSKQVIMFGGQTGNVKDPANASAETWIYDVAANKWTQMNPPSGPSRRGAPELAYDAESDRVIMFGGANEVLWGLNDTWAYNSNTNTWTEMAKGPARHLGTRLAYDAESDRIILFGGYDMSHFFYNDTWAYDFNSDTWTEMKPRTSPPGRNYQAIAYDSKADRVLVWGGLDQYTLAPIDESVWSYDYNANTWQEMKPGEGAHPTGRDYPAMAYDAESDRTILFGGFPPGGNETWAFAYSTNTWTKLEPKTVPGAGELSRHSMVYSAAADRVILFGGQVGVTQFNYTRDIWTYDLNTNTWTNVTPHP